MFKRRGGKGSMKGGSRIAKQALKVLGGLCFCFSTLPPVIYLLQWEYSQERLELNPYMLIAWGASEYGCVLLGDLPMGAEASINTGRGDHRSYRSSESSRWRRGGVR